MNRQNNQEERLERMLRAARAEPPPLPPTFAASVLTEIERRGLRVAPAPAVRRWKAASYAGVALALGGGMVLANALAFEVQMNGSLELLAFGTRFAGGFLAALPWDLLSGVLLLSALAGLLLHALLGAQGRLLPVGGRRGLAMGLAAALVLNGAGGGVLAATGVNEALQEQVEDANWSPPLVGRFFRERARYRAHHGMAMGQVLSQSGTVLTVRTPRGEELTVTVPEGTRVAPGEGLRMAGRERGGRFVADTVQPCSVSRLRNYGRMFMGPLRPGDEQGMGPGAHTPGYLRNGGMGPGNMGKGGNMGSGMGQGGMGPGSGMGPGMGQGGGMGPGPQRAQ